MIAVPGEPACTVDAKPDVLIGMGDEVPRRTVTVELPPGAVLCFYTDGLVERRDSSLNTGIDRLCDVVDAGPPEDVGAAVMAALIGRERAADDVAILVVRRVPG